MTHHGWMTANDSPDTSPQAGMHHVLRPAVAADAPALAQLGRESFCAAFGHLYRADDLGPFLHEAFDETDEVRGASCRERGWWPVENRVARASSKKKTKEKTK